MAYATAEDIADRLGRDLDESEERIVNARLEDVEALILTRIPNLDELVTTGKLNERLVVMAESDALMRLIRNPDGYRQETDGNYSYTIDQNVASGRLSLLPEEWQYLGVKKSIVMLAPGVNIPGCGTEGACVCGAKNPNADFESGICYGCQAPSPGGDHEPHTAVWA